MGSRTCRDLEVVVPTFAASGVAYVGRTMSVFHDEVEIEDFEYDEETGVFTYPYVASP